ncbi:amidohydrolase [Dyadobacter luteus]|uniref:Amidohydrolase n=1 Tax=Dyadobacter luteus TaxID=2259619 RepID=A0A3D8YE77_9BACT|nr:amidohydrolase [Dyadobacter luteus]REA62830.1 amidohydrolase [Dyadobacter luteus]
MKRTILAVLVSLFFVAFRQTDRDNTRSEQTADKIFINAKVLTIDADNSLAQSVAIGQGKILAVGSNADVLKLKAKNTQVVDLKGKTLIPGFIDGHSHFMGLGQTRNANLSPPPMGTVRNIKDIVAVLTKFKKDNDIKDGEWISAFGYDTDQLEEHRHPEKSDLDQAFPDNPVVLTHASGHMVVANSLALKLSSIDQTTKDPDGGTIVRKKGSQEPTGLLQESAARLVKRAEARKLTLEEKFEQLKQQQQLYASVGITTAQDGLSSLESVELLKKAAEAKVLYIDIISLPYYLFLDKLIADKSYQFGTYDAHLKLGGFKVTADGSPQGKTAFFSKPYLTEVPGCNHDECTGFANVTQEVLNKVIVTGIKNSIQPYVHCNGDATVDMYIKAIENANLQTGISAAAHRPVVIHSQFVRPDQLDKYKQLGLVPSFFTNHTFFWGDVHVKNLGKERAFFSSPLKSAIKRGITFTNHTDFGITPISQLFLLGSSVNRLSRTNVVIGPDERVTVAEGLRAITINGAYQYFEEKNKGSIEKGKLADLVILSDDPTSIDPLKIKDIQVLETIKEGKTIYVKNTSKK